MAAILQHWNFEKYGVFLMNDEQTNSRQLLKLAALACGYDFTFSEYDELLVKGKDRLGRPWNLRSPWNPLEKTHYGLADCLQMEIDLGLSVEKNQSEWDVRRNAFGVILSSNPDRQLASTMAAAKIGEAMKNG